jgi:hypothetical protein
MTLLQQNERLAEYKVTSITPESRLILQQWMKADYQLYNYFQHKINDEIHQLGLRKVGEDLQRLLDLNDDLINRCNPHFVDNESLRGTPLAMLHPMVKAYNISEKCIQYATSEPSFYAMIQQSQELKLNQ